MPLSCDHARLSGSATPESRALSDGRRTSAGNSAIVCHSTSGGRCDGHLNLDYPLQLRARTATVCIIAEDIHVQKKKYELYWQCCADSNFIQFYIEHLLRQVLNLNMIR